MLKLDLLSRVRSSRLGGLALTASTALALYLPDLAAAGRFTG